MKVDCWSSFYTAVVKSKEISFYFHLVLCNTHKSELGKSTGSFQLSVHNSVGDHALMTLCDWFTKNSCHNLTNQMFHLIHCWLGHACSAARGAASTKSGSDRIADRIKNRPGSRTASRLGSRTGSRIGSKRKKRKKKREKKSNQIKSFIIPRLVARPSLTAFTSFSRVLPTSRVVYCASKSIEREVYCLNKDYFSTVRTRYSCTWWFQI